MDMKIDKDIKMIDEKIESLQRDRWGNSSYQPQAVNLAVAALLRAKAELIKALYSIPPTARHYTGPK